MLRPEYLSRKLTTPLPTKDGGTLRTIGEACEYMAAIGKEREQRLHWQRVREVMLQEADEAAVTWRVQLAVLKDAKLDVTALSEPIERMIGEPPPGLLSNAELNVMEEDEQPTELTESNERSDSDGREERQGVQHNITSTGAVAQGIGNKRDRFGGRMRPQFLHPSCAECVHPRVIPHVRTRAAVATELDIVQMRTLADAEYDDELVLAAIK